MFFRKLLPLDLRAGNCKINCTKEKHTFIKGGKGRLLVFTRCSIFNLFHRILQSLIKMSIS